MTLTAMRIDNYCYIIKEKTGKLLWIILENFMLRSIYTVIMGWLRKKKGLKMLFFKN